MTSIIFLSNYLYIFILTRLMVQGSSKRNSPSGLSLYLSQYLAEFTQDMKMLWTHEWMSSHLLICLPMSPLLFPLTPSLTSTTTKPQGPLCYSLNEKTWASLRPLALDLPSVWNALAPDIRLFYYSLTSFTLLIQGHFCREISSDHLISNSICSPLCHSLSPHPALFCSTALFPDSML